MMKLFLTDLRRLQKNVFFYIAVCGVAGVLFFSLERKGIRDSMLETYIASVTGSGIHISGIFCMMAYGTVFCEDMEHRYIDYVLTREKIAKYVISKILIIFFSAIFVMCAGTLLFCVGCKFFLKETSISDSVLNITISGAYGNLIQQKRYLLYCLAYSVQLGMFMGNMAVISACLSMFTWNKVLILVFPVLLDQLLLEIPFNNTLNFLEYWPILNQFESDWQNFLYLCGISFACILSSILFIYNCLKKFR